MLINRYISGASKTFTREMACCTPFVSTYVTATCISMSTTILEIILKLLYSHTLSINSGIYVQVRHFGYRVYLIQVGNHFSSMRFWTGTKSQSCIYTTNIDKKLRVSRILQKSNGRLKMPDSSTFKYLLFIASCWFFWHKHKNGSSWS